MAFPRGGDKADARQLGPHAGHGVEYPSVVVVVLAVGAAEPSQMRCVRLARTSGGLLSRLCTHRMIFSPYDTQMCPVRCAGRGDPSAGSIFSHKAFIRTGACS